MGFSPNACPRTSRHAPCHCLSCHFTICDDSLTNMFIEQQINFCSSAVQVSFQKLGVGRRSGKVQGIHAPAWTGWPAMRTSEGSDSDFLPVQPTSTKEHFKTWNRRHWNYHSIMQRPQKVLRPIRWIKVRIARLPMSLELRVPLNFFIHRCHVNGGVSGTAWGSSHTHKQTQNTNQ